MKHNGRILARRPSWLERAIATQITHVNKIKEVNGWTISDTAVLLNRSLGGVCEDLLIVSWLRTHENKLKSFRYAKDALAFIREEKQKMKARAYE
jgi:hypothetical protein